MKKKRLVNLVVAAIAVITSCLGFTACMDDAKNLYKEKEIEEPNSFDFSTKKTMEFTLKYDVPTGYRVRFEMYTKCPVSLDEFKSYVKDSTMIPFYSGTTDADGSVIFKGQLPATVSEIYAYSPAIGMPLLMKASVSNEGTVSAFEKIEVKAAPKTRATTGASGTSEWTTYSVSLEKPVLESVHRIITSEDKMLIDKSFVESQNYELVTTYYQPSIRLIGEAQVKIYSVSNGAKSNRTNSLAYFTYTKNDEVVKPDDVNSNLQLVFSELNKTVPAEGNGFQLLYDGNKKFPSGTSIGFALFPDITPGSIKTENAHVLYSCFNDGSWNCYNYSDKGGLKRASAPHMVLSLLRQDADGHAIIAIGFEDQPWSGNFGTNKGDFRDDIFIVEIDPATSLPGDLPTPPVEDVKWDREMHTSGILCFEDCWPIAGDYDINDIVVAYERTHCFLGYIPVANKEIYTFLHNGANFKNGFGYQLKGLNRTNIQKCTVQSKYTYQGQGLDTTSDDAIVMLFDNGKNIAKGTTFEVFTTFSSGEAIDRNVPINPFIVVRDGTYGKNDILSNERTEIHLPSTNPMFQYLPTKKASTAYWGKGDDKSDPAKKRYYVRQGSYPFALDIQWENDNHDLSSITIPTEQVAIELTYPRFKSWVDSNGTKDKDWYWYPNK